MTNEKEILFDVDFYLVTDIRDKKIILGFNKTFHHLMGKVYFNDAVKRFCSGSGLIYYSITEHPGYDSPILNSGYLLVSGGVVKQNYKGDSINV